MADLPPQMTAIEISTPGGPDVLRPTEVPTPQPGQGQILVKAAFVGVNRPDVLQRAGAYPPPPGHSPLPGLETAGHVVAVGPGVSRFKLGDPVMALLNGGGYAQYNIAEETSALAVPQELPLDQAAGVPETFFTVWHNVFQRGRLVEGEWLLVHGGSSGIGTTAIQLARSMGANVITTAGSDAKCQACRDLGADVAVNYRTEDFVEAAVKATGGHGVNVILDMVGGDYISRNLKTAAIDGRIVQIAFLQGPQVEVNLLPVMLKRLTFTGSTLRPQSREAKAEIARDLEAKVVPLLAAGKVRPQIHARFPLAQAGDAHALMETSTHIGKIILEV